MHRILYCITFVIISATTADSAVLWDESVDGPSDNTPVLTLLPGTNEILGSAAWIGSNDDPFFLVDRNRYDLVLPEGLTLNSITVLLTNINIVTDSAFISANATWSIQDPAFNFVWRYSIDLVDGTTAVLINDLPTAGSDTLRLNQSASLSATGSWDLSWDYHVILETTAVPLPLPLFMFLSGLSTLGLLSLRR